MLCRSVAAAVGRETPRREYIANAWRHAAAGALAALLVAISLG